MNTSRIPSELVGIIHEYLGYIPGGTLYSVSTHTLELLKTYSNLQTIIRCTSGPYGHDQARFAVSQANIGMIPYEPNQVAIEAASKGYLDIVKWSFHSDANDIHNMLVSALNNNHMDIVSYVIDEGERNHSIDICDIMDYLISINDVRYISSILGMYPNGWNWNKLAINAILHKAVYVVPYLIDRGATNYSEMLVMMNGNSEWDNVVDLINNLLPM